MTSRPRVSRKSRWSVSWPPCNLRALQYWLGWSFPRCERPVTIAIRNTFFREGAVQIYFRVRCEHFFKAKQILEIYLKRPRHELFLTLSFKWLCQCALKLCSKGFFLLWKHNVLEAITDSEQ